MEEIADETNLRTAFKRVVKKKKKKKKGSKPDDATAENEAPANRTVDFDSAVTTAFTERDQPRPPTGAKANAEPLSDLPPPAIPVGLPGSPPAFDGEERDHSQGFGDSRLAFG